VSSNQVKGSGAEYGLMGAFQGQISLRGTWTGSTFSLVITPASGSVLPATYTGSMVSPSELQGRWSEGGHSSTLLFHRD
jgi:hypothetical protein